MQRFSAVYLLQGVLIKIIFKHLKGLAFFSLAPDLLRLLMQMGSIALPEAQPTCRSTDLSKQQTTGRSSSCSKGQEVGGCQTF